MNINIAHLYPDTLNMSADKGNILALKSRISKRNIQANVKEYKINEEINFTDTDIILLGGGYDKDRPDICKKLLIYKDKITKYLEKGGILIAVSSSYPIIGNTFQNEGETYQGLGIIDMDTVAINKRKTGNVILKSHILDSVIAGFENHTDKTTFNSDITNLGSVIFGALKGENEGVLTKNIIATHLHGPILPKNPALTDYIIGKVLFNKYNIQDLPDADSYYEDKAHDYVIKRFIQK